MIQSIKEHRQFASLMSGGTSSDPIYTKFIEIIKQSNLGGDCLDFGAGTGNLSKKINDLSLFDTVTASDIMLRPDELEPSIKWFTCDLNDPLNLPDHSFDAIVSSEVIEHLENPRAIARELFRLLRPNGTLILSTPNNESWRSLISLLIQGHFVAFVDSCYPAHITALLRKDIERILNEAGFLSIKFMFTDFGGIPKLPQRSYQEFSFGFLKGLRYSDNLLVIAKKLK